MINAVQLKSLLCSAGLDAVKVRHDRSGWLRIVVTAPRPAGCRCGECFESHSPFPCEACRDAIRQVEHQVWQVIKGNDLQVGEYWDECRGDVPEVIITVVFRDGKVNGGD